MKPSGVASAVHRQAILTDSRQAFQDALAFLYQALPERCCQRIFTLAEETRDFNRHRFLMEVFQQIKQNSAALTVELQRQIGTLLDRSMETVYATYRPSIHDVVRGSTLQLVDTADIEDDVRLKKIVGLYHQHVGATLQELNVRIANLFEQSVVRERENPFRPYLIAKSVALAGAVSIRSGYLSTAVEQLALTLVSDLDAIYRQINRILDDAQVSAEPPRPVADDTARPVPARDATAFSSPTAGVGARSATAPAEPRSPARRLRELAERWTSRLLTGQGEAQAEGQADANPNVTLAADALRHADRGTGGRQSGATGQGSGVAGAPRHTDVDVDVRATQSTPSTPLADPQPGGVRAFLARLAAQRASDTAAGATATGAPAAGGKGGGSTPILRYLAEHEAEFAIPSGTTTPDAIPNLTFEHRDELNSHTRDLTELISIEMIGMLFEYILRDSQVPAEVRAQLGRLQLYLLRMALTDPAVLVDKTHPSRRLINRIGSVSIALADDAHISQMLNEQVQRTVETLLDAADYSYEVAEQQLALFEEAVEQLFRSANSQLSKEIATLDEAEHRSVRLDDLMRRIGHALTVFEVPEEIRRFLLDDWSRVLEAAERTAAPDVPGYRAVIAQLLWSVLPKNDEASRKQLILLLGELLHRIKVGLRLIEMPAERADPFLHTLLTMHRLLIKQATTPEPSVLLATVGEHVARALSAAGMVEADTQAATPDTLPEIHPSVARALSLPAEPDPMPDDGVAAEDDAPAVDETDSARAQAELHQMVAERLHAGVKVEINLDGEPQTGLLTWRGKRVANLLLTFGNGHRPTTLSFRLFRVLLQRKRARFLEATPLFERAVESVLHATEHEAEADATPPDAAQPA